MAAAAPLLGTGPRGPVTIDLGRLAQSRMLIQGGSGAGKSWLVRRLLEQTHGHIQQIVLDVEDEYPTLRERFDLLLGGPGRDFPIEARAAALLAKRLLELGMSAILNLSELDPDEQPRFVGAFLGALVGAPRDLWRPALVIVDEAQRLAPKQGGDTACTKSVIDLMQRGRKRGLIGVAVTPRIADLHNSVCALAQNRLIGCTTLDVDVARAVRELGFKPADGRRLAELEPGHFFGFGPAISKEVIPIQVGTVQTTHGPSTGARREVPAPTRGARAMLAKLVDLPEQARAEEREVETLRARVRELERERAKPAPAPVVDTREIELARQELADVLAHYARQETELTRRLVGVGELLGKLGEDLETLRDRVGEALTFNAFPRPPRRESPARTRERPAAAAAANGQDPAPPGRRGDTALETLAQLAPMGLTEAQWATFACLKMGGGAWSKHKRELRAAEHVEERDGLWYATRAGIAAAGVVPLGRPASPEEAISRWAAKPGMRRAAEVAGIVLALCEDHGEVSKDQLAARLNVARSGGAFSLPLRLAAQAGLIEIDGDLVRVGEALLL